MAAASIEFRALPFDQFIQRFLLDGRDGRQRTEMFGHRGMYDQCRHFWLTFPIKLELNSLESLQVELKAERPAAGIRPCARRVAGAMKYVKKVRHHLSQPLFGCAVHLLSERLKVTSTDIVPLKDYGSLHQERLILHNLAGWHRILGYRYDFAGFGDGYTPIQVILGCHHPANCIGKKLDLRTGILRQNENRLVVVCFHLLWFTEVFSVTLKRAYAQLLACSSRQGAGTMPQEDRWGRRRNIRQRQEILS
jgi:hypothetical protein